MKASAVVTPAVAKTPFVAEHASSPPRLFSADELRCWDQRLRSRGKPGEFHTTRSVLGEVRRQRAVAHADLVLNGLLVIAGSRGANVPGLFDVFDGAGTAWELE